MIRAMPFDFNAVSAPFRMQPGLRRLGSGAKQLTPNRLDSRELAEKLDVLTRHSDSALLATAGFDPAPALQALMRQAALEHPDACRWDGADQFDARWLGWSLHGQEVAGDGPPAIGRCLRALPARWRLAGLLCLALAEDFAVIDGNTTCIPWLAVCLPSHWAPQDKIGRHFAEVHAPVADNQVLLAASDHLARLVSGEDRWERFVWTLSSDLRLNHHPQLAPCVPWPPGASAADLALHTAFRTEHQTFIPMPDRRQAVFTIHVESRALTDAVTTVERAHQLHDALASMSPAVLAYRGLTGVRERLLAWLRERAGPGFERGTD
jgi:dimethylamine monooxygenase subunit A